MTNTEWCCDEIKGIIIEFEIKDEKFKKKVVDLTKIKSHSNKYRGRDER